MSRGRKGKDRRERGDSRSLWIMMSAAVVLGIVIIAMAVQLVRLNRQGEQDRTQLKTEASVDQKEKNKKAEKPSETKKPSEEKVSVEHIRKNLDPDKPMVALTFDDGPYDRVTNRIVRVLAKHDSRATFFVVGNRVERYADTMKNAFQKGNQIATHTFDHGDLSKMKKRQMRRELKRAFRVMKKINGENPTMLRPPYGNVNDKMRQTIQIPMIYWSVDTEDWASRNRDRILSRCKNIKDGDIVLMHDLYPSTAAAVGKLVPKLRKKGFQLVTVEELFYYKGIDAKGGKVYFSGR